jgi:hypothetical protein
MRLLTDSLGATSPTDPPGAAAATASFFIPNDGSVFPALPDTGNQRWPAIAIVQNKYYVAYEDDGGSTNFDVKLRSMSSSLAADPNQGPGTPLAIAATSTEEGQPAIAASNNSLFIAWQTAPSLAADGSLAPGSIVGGVFVPGSTSVASTNMIDSSANAQHVRVAGTANGWVVVWESGTDVKMSVIDMNGNPKLPQTVNGSGHHGVQDHPDVAAIEGGGYAIAWADHGAPGGTDIFVQRYSAMGIAVPNDQSQPINNVVADGEQITPAIAAGASSGGMFAVAWLDVATGHVRARLLGAAAGFRFNNVDSKDDEFQASIIENHERANPVVVIGGTGQFVAIGWEDLDPSQPGIYARRFPVPQ